MKRVHVAVGVIRNQQNEVLISLRPNGAHMGGLWEFPGGKLEGDERPLLALKRELQEELGIVVNQAEPLIRVHHDYADKNVLLDVWEVTAWSGQPKGCEGQPIEWASPDRLYQRQFPEANLPIIQAVVLPKTYPIIDASLGGPEALIQQLQYCLASGHRMLQLRAKSWSGASFESLIKEALTITKLSGAQLLINSDVATAVRLGADGVHLNSSALMAIDCCLDRVDLLIGASCHNLAELVHAERVGVQFAVLSPVGFTSSHSMATPLGWDVFKQLVEGVNLPVYALGGMMLHDYAQARLNGAQGLSGIRLFRDQNQIES